MAESSEYEELYSIIITIDRIERALMRDSIDQEAYIESVNKLLSHASILITSLEGHPDFTSIKHFAAKYDCNASIGLKRIKLGIPATAEASHLAPNAHSGMNTNGKAIAEVAGNFITFCDGVHLNFRGKEDLHPLLAELVLSLNKATKSNFEGRNKLVNWLIKLNSLKSLEKISDAESVQILIDVEAAYNAFLGVI